MPVYRYNLGQFGDVDVNITDMVMQISWDVPQAAWMVRVQGIAKTGSSAREVNVTVALSSWPGGDTAKTIANHLQAAIRGALLLDGATEV